MPNQIKGYKHRVATTGRVHAGPGRKGASVKTLLERMATPTLTRISEQANAQTRWREWLRKHLPPELAARVSGVVEQGGKLTIFTESAAWSARVRYAIADLEPLIGKEQAGIGQVVVRVMPKK